MKSFLKLFFILVSGTFILSQSYATVYVCPRTYQTIITGYSMQQVKAACGNPTSSKSEMTQQTKPMDLTQWVYTIGRPNNSNQFTPQMHVTFYQDKVTEISISNQSVATSFPCYSNNRIQVGTTKAQVHIQCGAPTFVNSIQKGYSRRVKKTILTYNFGAYKPLMIFTFENDKLTRIETGPLAK